MKTTTYGTGQLIKHALDMGCRNIILGIGGSATNDGGCGMAIALGAGFLDKEGKETGYGGESLGLIETIDISKMDPRIKECKVVAACDVDNPLIGPKGASRIFGPQKGAAGGLGGGLLAFLNATLKRGIDMVIETAKLEESMADADLVITGEGMIDYQTIYGKTPYGVAKAALKYKIPVIAIAGGIGEGTEILYENDNNALLIGELNT